jgi:hypothetical protein
VIEGALFTILITILITIDGQILAEAGPGEFERDESGLGRFGEHASRGETPAYPVKIRFHSNR